MTKAIVSVAMFLASATAFAAGPNSSWQEILKSPQYQVRFPQVQFGSTYVPVYNTCVQGDFLKAAVNTCTAWSTGGEEGGSCVQTARNVAAIPLVSTETRCTSYQGEQDCGSYQTFTRTIALSYDVEVRTALFGENGGEVAFTKRFVIPACR